MRGISVSLIEKQQHKGSALIISTSSLLHSHRQNVVLVALQRGVKHQLHVLLPEVGAVHHQFGGRGHVHDVLVPHNGGGGDHGGHRDGVFEQVRPAVEFELR